MSVELWILTALCGGLALVLAWYVGAASMGDRIATVTARNRALEGRVTDLETQNGDKDRTIKVLWEQIERLEKQVSSLELVIRIKNGEAGEAQLHRP
jgi:hypothetical protein